MDSPNDGIVYSNPVLGQPLFVQNDSGEMVNCGQVIGCEYRAVMRGTTGFVVYATMIFVKTTKFTEGFAMYPAIGTPLPEPFLDTVQQVA
ncbi:MAG: hypothetical protein A2172_02750 [Candidatus Woykebacteria bacterium RBG_13_40_15]|uniref:Uncharacterized protein n=1 Tax=Candidatus Woykebacteria bacterium RBG_13_40_15 TaxID=1802593 RepID=A0A1G1W9Z3_9BACT|nr:MAG: hypothetical protein A2172_02750 [Candidatus Woykebacteria bacterium RBG_13_40_15]